MDIKGGFSKQLTKINLKTSAFMEENKIDSYIASLQKEIGELKKRMGEMTYTLLKEDRLEASAFSSIMAEIDEREQRIAAESDRKRQLLARNQEILNKVLSGQAKPVDYSLFPWYILDSNLPQTNMEGRPIYYASGEQFGTLLGYWQGPTGMAARQYLQGAYVSINENFTKH